MPYEGGGGGVSREGGCPPLSRWSCSEGQKGHAPSQSDPLRASGHTVHPPRGASEASRKDNDRVGGMTTGRDVFGRGRLCSVASQLAPGCSGEQAGLAVDRGRDCQVHSGLARPYLRKVSGNGRGAPPMHVARATLGLAAVGACSRAHSSLRKSGDSHPPTPRDRLVRKSQSSASVMGPGLGAAAVTTGRFISRAACGVPESCRCGHGGGAWLWRGGWGLLAARDGSVGVAGGPG